MRATRREFVRWLGAGAAGAIGLSAEVAWAQRRILGDGGKGEPPAGGPGQVSPELHRFLSGIRVGEMRQQGLLQVVWLEGPAGPSLPVATLEEARVRGDLIVTEREQATVPELIVDNRGKVYVLLLAGEILLGGKQNRVLTEDILLPPLSGPRNLGVYCVEQGRWAAERKEFDARGSFAAPGLRAKVLERADQGRIWAEVERYANRAAAPSPTRSYQAIYDKAEVKAHMDEAERRLDARTAPAALGAAVFAGAMLVGLDLFFDPGLFAREWPKLLRAQALDVYGRKETAPDADGALARGQVEALLRRAAMAEGSVRSNAGAGRLFEFRVSAQRGAALLFEGRAIHTAIL